MALHSVAAGRADAMVSLDAALEADLGVENELNQHLHPRLMRK